MSTGAQRVAQSDINVHPYLDHVGPIPFAHRGGASEAPENTMSAFADAVDLGYTYLETDVHATCDGVLVAFHDDDLSRTCGQGGHIQDLSWEQLRGVKVHGGEPIPLLEDILDAFPKAKINIDCKTDTALQPLIDVLARRGCLDRVCVGSFSDKRLVAIRRHFGPDLCTSMGPRQIAQLLFASKTSPRYARSLTNFVAQIPTRQTGLHLTSTRLLTMSQKLGIPVHVWTIDDEQHMHELLNAGVDGIMTDKTRLLKDVFIQRNIWPQQKK
jgi:glycerophosphoryl diester phosphodiesterase